VTVRQHAASVSPKRAILGIAIFLALAAELAYLAGAIGVFLFVFALLFSIGLHEFGHFITAKWFGMKVHRFMIGFPPTVWSYRKGETEYGIGSIPLGGFVKIAGMNPFEDVPPEDRDRVFSAKKPWQRAVVLSAGSATHFALALIIISGVLMIAGEAQFDHPLPRIADVQQTFDGNPSPAVEAGLEVGDEIVAFAGQRITSWEQVVQMITARAGRTVPIVVDRAGKRRTLEVTPAPALRACADGAPTVEPAPPGTPGSVGYLGLEPSFDSPTRPIPRIAGVLATLGDEPSPASAAGFEVGDVVVRAGDTPIRDWNRLIEVIAGNPATEMDFVVDRGGARTTLHATIARVLKRCGAPPNVLPAKVYKDYPFAEVRVTGFIGMGPEYPRKEYRVFGAVGEAGSLIGRGSVDALKGLKDLFSPSRIGRLLEVLANRKERSVYDPSTIIGLGQQAGGLAKQGAFADLFLLIAGFNIFIGVANMLPLPPLDGGHLAVVIYEKIRRRRVDMRRLMPVTAAVIMIFGSLFVLLLLLDITRPLPPIGG
jgi:membrane-associated protease RseP (regulator of RpoE activity)